jgi:ABC-type multidrug transport system fused ATPase/permease subunit
VRHLRPRIELLATLRTIWPFVQPDRAVLAQATVVALLLTTVDISIPLTIHVYVDLITGGRRAYERDLPAWAPVALIVILLAAALTRGGLLARQRALAGRIGERAAARLRSDLWSHLQKLPVEKIEDRGSGRLLVRFVSDIRSVQRLVTDILIQGTQGLLCAAVVLVILLLLNWRMALPALLLVPTFAAMFWLLNPRLRRQSRATRRRRTRLSAFLNQRILGMKVVKALGQERSESLNVRRMTRALARRGARLAATAATLQGATTAAITGSIALTLALTPGEIAAGRATGGTPVAFIMLLGLLGPMLRRVAQVNRWAQEAHVSIGRLRETLDQRPETGADAPDRPLRVRAGHVKVSRVSLVGEDGVPVLDRVSLDARRGEIVAVIGPNGSGKSTLLDLLLRFKRPTSGRIVVDGRRIENVALASLRTQIGWVPQEAVLFDGTLRENITYGARRRPSAARIDQAVRRSGLEQVVRRLPDGLDGRVGAGGPLLSHGERQRVALARALIANPPILILDELASGADAETDQALADLLRTLARRRTLIVATHQLPILRVADRIYVLKRGRVVERGAHAELLRRGTVYARLLGAGASPALEVADPPDTPEAIGPRAVNA